MLGNVGTGDNVDINKPKEVVSANTGKGLENIKTVSSGNGHSVALAKDGSVYTWGQNDKGQLGDGTQINSYFAIKVDGLKDIVKVIAYQNITIALDKDGKVYVWGESYSSLPMRLISSNKMIDVSGRTLLSQEGYIYDISDLETRVNTLSQIAKISSGKDHNLALSVYGYVYSWGANNDYGELAKNSNCITAQIMKNVYEINAGNDTTFVKTEDDEVFVAGSNTNGRIGLGNTNNAKELTKIDIGEKIENIAVGIGEHNAISDCNGFVYTTGVNTYGELGNESNTNKQVFTKIGDTIIVSEPETIYLDLNEVREIEYELINTFNLKVDIVDSEKSHFTLTIPDNTKLSLNDYNTITAIDYGTNNVTITHNETGKTKQIIVKVIKKMNDIIRGIRDCNLTDGNYDIMIKDEIYNIELYNYYGDVKYTNDTNEEIKTINLGNDVKDQTMLVVKYHGDLTIDEDVVLTAAVRKKGMYVCVLGDLVNNGEITMTAKGADVEEGQNVYLWENIDSSYEYVPANGAEGLEAFQPKYTREGNIGNEGTGRQTGSGGQGSAIINTLQGSIGSWIGKSTGGNSYAGGNGSGAIVRCNISALPAVYTEASHEKGGNGNAWDNNAPTQYFAGGGAGLTGGESSYCRYGTTGTETKAQDGVRRIINAI